MLLKNSARLAGVAALVALCLISGTIGCRKTSDPVVDLAAAEATPQQAATVQQAVKSMPAPQARGKRAAAPKSTATKPAIAPAVETRTVAADSEVPVMEARSNVAVREQETAVVTITGCVEQDDATFQLKETAGIDAPKSRGWKSGFLKKSSASIELIDSANRLKLPTHVGQRVSVTGMLEDRAMNVRSLRRVAEPCD